MGKTRDLIQILLVVIIGVLIPFFGSIIINFDMDFTKIDNLLFWQSVLLIILWISQVALVCVLIVIYRSKR